MTFHCHVPCSQVTFLTVALHQTDSGLGLKQIFTKSAGLGPFDTKGRVVIKIGLMVVRSNVVASMIGLVIHTHT